MPRLDIDQAKASDMTNKVDDVEVSSMSTDGISDQKETQWSYGKDWNTYWGYFNSIPDLHSALIMKAIWNTGKGYEADEGTKIILDRIVGWGKDCFSDILFNMDVTRHIGGDSFAEIVRSDDDILINLKPLDPSSIRVIVDGKGIIKRYEQISKLGQSPTAVRKFQPEEIFHLSCNRIADQVHGISVIQALQKTIDAENESFEDMKKLIHHQVKPFILWKLKTDDPVKIQEIVNKIDSARNLGEDMFIPDDDDAVSYEVVKIDVNQAVFEWRTDIRNKFYRSLGLPLIIFGSAGSTESGGKVEYLAHEQVFERDQKYIENQIWQQLALKIDLKSPTSLLNNLQTDEAKDANQGLEIQPQDATAGAG